MSTKKDDKRYHNNGCNKIQFIANKKYAIGDLCYSDRGDSKY